MDINKDDDNLLDKLSRYEAEIESLKNKNEANIIKSAEQEKLLAACQETFDNSGIGIVYGNNKGQITGANAEALKMTKYSLDEINQMNIKDIFINENTTSDSSKITANANKEKKYNEQILFKKNRKKIFVHTQTTLLPNNNYQILIKKIQKRKKAEQELAELKYRYQQLAENIKDVIWSANMDMKILYISGAISKITGFIPEIYYNRPLNELMTPISHQILLDAISRGKNLSSTDRQDQIQYPVFIEIKLLHKYHANIWAELSIAPILNHFGEVVGYQGMLRNIDEHKKTLENLNKSNHRYNFALKTSGSGFWELNSDLTWINVDENLMNILGYKSYKPKTFLNDWITLTSKEDRIHFMDVLQDILDGKIKSSSYECQRIHKDGSLIWFSDYVEGVFDDNGNIIEIIGTSKNINNEKLTEEKKYRYYAGLQLLIDSTIQYLNFEKLDQIYNYAGQILNQKIPNSIVIFCTIEQENNKIRPFKYYGVDNPSTLKEFESLSKSGKEYICQISNKAFNLLEQRFLIEFKHGFDEFIGNGHEGKICETISETYNNYQLYVIGVGTKRNLTESILIIKKDGGEIINKEFIEAFISLSSIIIDKKKIELELVKINESKDKFFSIISHDLKNPFNTFIGFSGLIIQNIDRMPKEKILEFAKLIHNAGLQNYEMMTNLFEWAKSQKGTLSCQPVNIDINGIITTNTNLFLSEATNKSIKIEAVKGPEIDFYADFGMLNTILRNLVSNAIKFTPEGGNISVSYKINEDNVLFSVKDDGTGIPKAKHDNLFDLNKNVSTPGTNKEKGSGLGLILCHEFVSAHGGRIWVESIEDQGTEFLFTIPRTQIKS